MDVKVTCGIGVTSFWFMRPAVIPPPVAPPPTSKLLATVSVPAAVGRGGVLDYIVTLSNHTSQAVTLEPCPDYVEALIPANKRTYQLNCDTVTSIGPGQAVRYAMQLDVPAGASTGPAQLCWTLEEAFPATVAGCATIQIT